MKLGLTGHNVVVRTTLDELPIAFVAFKRVARDIAAKVTEAKVKKAANLMAVDSAGIVVVAIISYRRGVPIGLDIVREWEHGEEQDSNG